MNLTTFHITDKSIGKFVAENTCSIEGQGLVDTYDILLFGNTYNTYIFTLIDHNNMFHYFTTKDKYLIKWRIRFHPEDATKEYDTIEFRAFGIIDQKLEWNWANSCDCDDYTHLEIGGIKYFVNSIHITNKHPEIPPVRDIYDEQQYWEKCVSINCKNIQKVLDSNDKKHDYYMVVPLDKIKLGSLYYLVSENKIFPMVVNAVKQKFDTYLDNIIDINATVTIQKIKTTVMLHIEEIPRDICEDRYNIHIDTDCKIIDDEIFFVICKDL